MVQIRIFDREITENTVTYSADTCFGQGNHQKHGHIWCIHTVLANPNRTVLYVTANVYRK
jgi:hypothetical protein